MTNITQQISKPKLLIGEGWEEVYFFDALLAHLNISDFQLEQYGGKNRLSSYLKTLPNRPGYRQVIALGITRDANNNAEDAFRSVCGALNRCGLAVPDAPGEVAGGIPRVGVLILPDGHNPGMLEDVCLAAIQTNPEMRCVDEYFKCIRETAKRQPGNLAKARVHAWLASQVQPDLRLGNAAQKGYWPWDNPVFDQIKELLRAL